jgi:hypothetical protein
MQHEWDGSCMVRDRTIAILQGRDVMDVQQMYAHTEAEGRLSDETAEHYGLDSRGEEQRR